MAKDIHETQKNNIIPFIPVSDSKRQLPSFTHPEILNLYNYGTEIPFDLLQQILDLPRESVISDLEKILPDAIDNYEIYSEDCDTTPDLVFHAIYLLAELDAKESLSKILAFLEGDEEIVDYWLDWHLTDTLWQTIYKLGQNNTGLFKAFLLKPDTDTFSKTPVSEALVQMVIQIPEKRDEILDIFKDVLEYYKKYLIEKNLKEDECLTYLIEDSAKGGLFELKTMVEELYDKNLVYLGNLPLSSYQDLLNKHDPFFRKRAILDIFHLYDDINVELDNFDDDDDFDDDDFEDDDDIDDNDYKIVKPLISHRTLNLDLPDFKHKIVEELFEYNMTISHDTLKTILELPREEIVPDLIMVIDFAINYSRNYHNSISGDWDTSKTNFPLHAMYLLAEMREEKAFDIILKILSLEEKYLNNWFGDFLTEEIWKILLLTGQNRLLDLAEVVTNYKNYECVRFAASQAMAQTVLLYPEKRNEVISLFQDILHLYIRNGNTNDYVSDEILGAVICDLADINATELLSSVKDCFDKKIVDLWWTGTYKEIENEFNKKIKPEYPITDIFKTYDSIVTKWASYNNESDELSNDDNDENNIVTSFDKPFTRESPKLGRNDPCFCGSGKKYKKCCMDK